MSVNHLYMKKRDKFDIEAIQIVEFRDGMKFIPNESPAARVIDAVEYITPFDIPYKRTKLKFVEFLYYDFFQKLACSIHLIKDARKFCIKSRCDEMAKTLKYDSLCKLRVISKEGDDPLNWVVNFYEFVEFIQKRFSNPSWIIPDYALDTAKTQREYADMHKEEREDTEEINKYARLWLRIMDTKDEYYSGKLACALAFREAVYSDSSILDNRMNIKEIVEKWLKAEISRFIIPEQGKEISQNVYDQIAYIVNWQKGGPRKG